MGKTTIRTRQELLPSCLRRTKTDRRRPHSLKQRARPPTLPERATGCQSTLIGADCETEPSPVDRLTEVGTSPTGSAHRSPWRHQIGALTILGIAMVFHLDCVGRRYTAAAETLDRVRHQAYAEAVGASARSSAGFTRPLACFAAVYLLWPIVPQLFQDPEVGLDLEHLLHGEQEFSFERSLAFDELITPEGEIAQVDQRRSMVFLDLRCQGRDRANQVVARSRSLFVVKGTG